MSSMINLNKNIVHNELVLPFQKKKKKKYIEKNCATKEKNKLTGNWRIFVILVLNYLCEYIVCKNVKDE